MQLKDWRTRWCDKHFKGPSLASVPRIFSDLICKNKINNRENRDQVSLDQGDQFARSLQFAAPPPQEEHETSFLDVRVIWSLGRVIELDAWYCKFSIQGGWLGNGLLFPKCDERAEERKSEEWKNERIYDHKTISSSEPSLHERFRSHVAH